MSNQLRYNIINIFIALVWLINGLYCKFLNFVPRHQEIVGQILSLENPRILTAIIGMSEIVMAIWSLSKYKPKLNALTQIIVIMLMNILETILVPDLLLWGRLNILFALSFCLLILYNEFGLIIFKRKTKG